MNRARAGILLLSAACALCGCSGTKKPATAIQPPPRTIQLSRDLPVIYHRTGGFAGVDERVVIWPDRVVMSESKPVQGPPRTLLPAQHQRFLALLERCQESPAPAPSGAMDVFCYTIQHGGQTIRADDVSMSPEVRDLVREMESALGDSAAVTSTESR